MPRTGPGLSVGFEITHRPDFRGITAQIRAERSRIYTAATSRLISQLIPSVIRSQGSSVGTEWGNRSKHAGGAPALLSLIGRFSARITADSFYVALNHPYGRHLQFGGRLKTRGKLFVLPFPGVSGRPSDYRNTFVRPAKRVPGAFVVFERTGKGPKDFRPIFLETPQVVLPQRLFLSWFEQYRAAVQEEVERAVDDVLSHVGTRGA